MASSSHTCSNDSERVIQTIMVTPTMTTFDIDLSSATREKALFVELSPPVDATEYFVDDMQLLQ
jgi:hypothetical protein